MRGHLIRSSASGRIPPNPPRLSTNQLNLLKSLGKATFYHILPLWLQLQDLYLLPGSIQPFISGIHAPQILFLSFIITPSSKVSPHSISCLSISYSTPPSPKKTHVGTSRSLGRISESSTGKGTDPEFYTKQELLRHISNCWASRVCYRLPTLRHPSSMGSLVL